MLKYLVAVMLSATPLLAAPVTFESDESPATLVELFTSEGCSSCPPADAWLSKLKSSRDLWKRFVPVAFHVDYWNNLGWTDRFSSAAYSDRQRNYAAAWGTASIYTPGFVLDGHEWPNWSQHDTVPSVSAAKVGRLAITIHDSSAEVIFTRLSGPTPALIEVALLGNNLESSVTRGENGGHKLHHDFTVLHSTAVSPQHDGSRFTATVSLPKKTLEASTAIAAWITPGEARPPIQATGGWLRQP